MIRLVARDKLVLARMAGLLPILPRKFDGRFHRFRRARVRFDIVHPRRCYFAQLLDEVERHVRDAVHWRRERHEVDLPLDGIHHRRVTMPEAYREDTANGVEEALAKRTLVSLSLWLCRGRKQQLDSMHAPCR